MAVLTSPILRRITSVGTVAKASSKPLVVHVGVMHVRQCYRALAKLNSRTKPSFVPRFGEYGPPTYAIRAITKDNRWLIDSALIRHIGSGPDGSDRMWEIPVSLDAYMRGDQTIPFSFRIYHWR